MGGMFGSSSSVQQVNNLTPQQTQLFTGLGNLLSQNLGQGVQSYPGTYTAGPSQLQNQAFGLSGDIMSQYLPQNLQNISGYQNDIGNLTNQIPGYLQNLSSVTQPWNQGQAQNWWQSAVGNPAMSNWQQNIVPQVMEQFGAYGAANSGPAQQAMAQSGANLQTGLSSNLSNYLQSSQQQAIQNMLSGNQQQMQGTQLGMEGIGQQMQGTQLAGNMANQALQGGLQAGAQQRQITSEQMLEPYQQWLQGQSYNNPWLKYLEPYLTQQTFSNVMTPGQQSGIGGLLGGVGGLMTGAANLFT